MQLDTMYDMILNVHLCQIHHIRDGDIFVTQYNIMTKHLSEINNAII